VREGGPYINLRTEAARDEAARVDRRLPLAGFTLAVKDLIAIAGWPIGAGSRLREGAPPEAEDAPVVADLRRAGAILVGSTALHELALGVTGVNAYAGTPENPNMRGCIPGGSSSGSAAAVADGSARVALSTDTGGSARIPAALCGVVGFKPAYGDYDVHGVLPLAPTFDHVGLMARGVDDVRRVHEVLARPVPRDGRKPCIGLLRSSLETASAEVALHLERALSRLAAAGCAVREVTTADDEDVLWTSTTLVFVEAAAVHADSRERWATHAGATVRARLETGARTPPGEYEEALRRRRAITQRVQRELDEVDVLLTPTVPIPPPRLADADDPALPTLLVANTRLASLAGIPAISLPLGNGIGLQLMGRSAERLLADAGWVEEALRRAQG
jgi:Asp-tRNA(Asn)/Glu-tRNA(Gln) amidotransferase A subunit family amidase